MIFWRWRTLNGSSGQSRIGFGMETGIQNFIILGQHRGANPISLSRLRTPKAISVSIQKLSVKLLLNISRRYLVRGKLGGSRDVWRRCSLELPKR